ncbi:MAG TPA: DNA gyrase modulator, partial [Methylotenera sp.]|nr:DNA gyrase modulator [Methylotenera sp.]
MTAYQAMTASYFDILDTELLQPAELQLDDLQQALSTTMQPGVDYADLYFQRSRSENWLLEDGIIKDGGFHLDQGVGVRACSGEKTGFAYSDVLNKSALMNASKAARAVVKSGQQGQLKMPSPVSASAFYENVDPISAMSAAEKLELLRTADAAARAADPRVKRVTVSLAG